MTEIHSARDPILLPTCGPQSTLTCGSKAAGPAGNGASRDGRSPPGLDAAGDIDLLIERVRALAAKARAETAATPPPSPHPSPDGIGSKGEGSLPSAGQVAAGGRPSSINVVQGGADKSSSAPSLPTTASPEDVRLPPGPTLTAGDVVRLTVRGRPEFSGRVEIRADGTVALPAAGGAVPAAGKTPSELASAVAGALSPRYLKRKPAVEVAVEKRPSPSGGVGESRP